MGLLLPEPDCVFGFGGGIVNARDIHHANIMVECGCSVEDVAVTFRVTIDAALYFVAPALKNNKAAMKFARQHYSATKQRAKIPTTNRGLVSVDRIESRRDTVGAAA